MMPAGTYYIGDLCYVMHDVWDECVDLMFPDMQGAPQDGEFTLKDGRRFAVYSTKFGDGFYRSNIGTYHPVDAGCIGCILVSDIRDESVDMNRLSEFGAVYEFGTDFVTDGSRDTGTIQFGRVVIETDDPDGEEEDDFEYEEE